MKEVESIPGTIGLEPVQAVELIETLIDSKKLGSIVGSPAEFKPLIVLGDHLYLQKMFYLENRFVDTLRQRFEATIETATTPSPSVRWPTCSIVRGRGNGKPLTLTIEQALAVRTATRHPMTIIGGLGTGKTTIVLSPCALAQAGCDV